MASNITTVMPAPAGYIVNFDHPYQHGAQTGYIVAGVGILLSFSILMMRTYTRFFITRNAAFEDYLIIFAFACGMCTQSIILHVWAIKAAGVHAWEMPLERFNNNSLLTMIMSIMYVPCLGGAKLSIVLLYKRLSPVRWFHYCIYTLMTIIGAYSIAIVFALIFPCHPIAMNWDVTITVGKCADKAQIYLATAGVNIVTDLLILALPIPMVWSLQMPKVQKIGLIGMFALGSATCITSIIRLIYMVPMLTNPDATWAVSIPLVWVEVEVNLVIAVCCLPALRHFLRHFAPRWIGESRSASTKSNSNSNSKSNSHSHGTPDFSGYGGTKTISNITSRALRKSRGLDYDMMTRSDEDMELAMELTDKDRDRDVDSKHDGLDGGSMEALDDKDVEKAIWTTKTFSVK